MVHKCHHAPDGRVHHFFQYSGWSVEPITYKCIGCGECVKACPRGQLKVGLDGKIEMGEFCPGCGYCLKACKQGALHIVKTGETKDDLYEFFEKTGGQW